MQSRPAVPVSPPCPSNHLQAQVTAGGWRAALHLTGDAGPRTPLISAKPAPPNACGAGLGRGCGGHCACAARRPAPRRLRGGSSSRPSATSASPGVEPGRRGGRARGAGRPPDSGGTWCSGGERAPPRVPSTHWAARPGAGSVKGKQRGGPGPREGNGDAVRLRSVGPQPPRDRCCAGCAPALGGPRCSKSACAASAGPGEVCAKVELNVV